MEKIQESFVIIGKYRIISIENKAKWPKEAICFDWTPEEIDWLRAEYGDEGSHLDDDSNLIAKTLFKVQYKKDRKALVLWYSANTIRERHIGFWLEGRELPHAKVA